MGKTLIKNGSALFILPLLCIMILLCNIAEAANGRIVTVDGIAGPKTLWPLYTPSTATQYIYDAIDSDWRTDFRDNIGPVQPFYWGGNAYTQTYAAVDNLYIRLKQISDNNKITNAPLVIISHSWGTVLTYIVLHEHPDIIVDKLITMGSPLLSANPLVYTFLTKNALKHYHISYIKPLPNVNVWHNYWAECDPFSASIPMVGTTNYKVETSYIEYGNCHNGYYKDPLLWQNILPDALNTQWPLEISYDPHIPSAPADINFNAIGSLTVNAISYLWDFGDGLPVSGQSVTYHYVKPGNYNVKLTMTDDPDPHAKPHVLTKTVTVRQPPITVIYPNGFKDLYRHFETPKISEVKSYAWSFGDGVVRTDDNNTTSHTYATSGYFTVTLKQILSDDTSVQSQVGIFVGPGTRYIQTHTITGDETWYSDGTYVVQGNITIAKGASLTIQPGTTVKVANGSFLNVLGKLTATEVIFTGVDTEKEWNGIMFDSGSNGSKLDGCTIEHANGHWDAVSESIAIRSGASLTITGCKIKNSKASCGIFVENGAPMISNNVIDGFGSYGIDISTGCSGTYQKNTLKNNQYGIRVHYYMQNNPIITGNTYSDNSIADLYADGIINTAVIIGNGQNAVLQISSLQIAKGASLTIQPGTTVKMTNGGFLDVLGKLTATEVIFTGVDTEKEWGGIMFDSGSNGSKLDGCTIEHANGNWDAVSESIAIRSGASLTITGCKIKNSKASCGIFVENGAPMISNNVIDGFGSYGVYVVPKSSPVLTGNTITNNQYGIYILAGCSGTYKKNTLKNNTFYGIYYTGNLAIDATNCDWGDPTGPLDPSDDRVAGGWYNSKGLGDKVSDHVNYTPWIGSSAPVPGDITNNGVVDLADTVLALKVIVGIVPTQLIYKGTGINKDCRIGNEEAIYILQNDSGQR